MEARANNIAQMREKMSSIDWALVNQCLIQTTPTPIGRINDPKSSDSFNNGSSLVSSIEKMKYMVALQSSYTAACIYQAKLEACLYLREEQTYELRKEKYFKPKPLKNIHIKIGFIGCGSMGKAILDALLDYQVPDPSCHNTEEQKHPISRYSSIINISKLKKKNNTSYRFQVHHFCVSTRRPHNFLNQTSLSHRYHGKKFSQIGIQVCNDNQSVASGSDLVFLCVQPSQVNYVKMDITSFGQQTILVSVVAGVPRENLENIFKIPYIICCSSPTSVCEQQRESSWIYAQATSTPFSQNQLVRDACPQLNLPVGVGKDNLTKKSFFEQFFSTLVTLYEDKMPFNHCIRLVIFCLLRIDVSSECVTEVYHEMIKENLFNSDKQYKTTRFVKRLLKVHRSDWSLQEVFRKSFELVLSRTERQENLQNFKLQIEE